MKISVAAAVVLCVLGAALYFLVLQPERQAVSFQAGELLADGIGHYERKEYDLALEVLQQVPDGTVEEAQALYYAGSSYMMLKDYESAAVELEKALAVSPDSAGTLFALGVVYYKLGNLKLAKSYFASVLEINPGDEQAKGLMDIMAKLERQTDADK